MCLIIKCDLFVLTLLFQTQRAGELKGFFVFKHTSLSSPHPGTAMMLPAELRTVSDT
jgi:hypothetical protein